jgi:[protein-PII] uridylyltransferase
MAKSTAAVRTLLGSLSEDDALAVWRRSGHSAELSAELSKNIEHELKSISQWERARPIALGSWARGELCPKSDIDLLFAGAEDVALEIVEHFQHLSLPLRYRVPADADDWRVGVEVFDILALGLARPLEAEGALLLAKQTERWFSTWARQRRQWMKPLLLEREKRQKRHDSIVNYLEPNLKFGPGGLRDIEQALTLLQWRPEHFSDRPELATQIQEQKEQLLRLRQWLHLKGYGDVLVAQAQQEYIETELRNQTRKNRTLQSFMTDLQRDLFEAHEVSEWFCAAAETPLRRLRAVRKIVNFNQAVDALDTKSARDRKIAEEAVRSASFEVSLRTVPRVLNSGMKDQLLCSMFFSGLLGRVFPDFKMVQGYVQHDQYHRYTVDAHLVQVMREVLRAQRSGRHLGRLDPVARKLSTKDWDLLFWAAFFHDLYKGRPADHSLLGAREVPEKLKALGFSESFAEEVQWLVREHLSLSVAAFRKNPRDPRTWQDLFQKGVLEGRIDRLVLFTALDILGTNPEAWNDWKEKLLFDLCESLHSPTANAHLRVIEYCTEHGQKYEAGFFEALDPRVLDAIPAKILAKDSRQLLSRTKAAEPLIWRSREGQVWIRFHAPKDRPGLFLQFAGTLHELGLSVHEAYVQTLSQQGVYDWFRVRTQSDVRRIKRLLTTAKPSPRETLAGTFAVQFDRVDVTEMSDDECLISFRGKDQKGALVAAARQIARAELSIVWAKVTTWGRQIDDVFCVKVRPDQHAAVLSFSTDALTDAVSSPPQA